MSSLRRQKSILQVYKLYKPETGGVISVMRDIATGLANQFDFTILVTGKRALPKQEQFPEARIIRARSYGTLLSLPISISLIPLFWKYARKHHLVAYHYPTPWFDIAIALYFPRNTRLVVHWHAEIMAKRQKFFLFFLSPFIRRTLRRADCIIVSNPNMLPHSSFLASVQQKCRIVPFGIDADDWECKDAKEKKLVAYYRETYKNFFFACGRLIPYKGFDILIRAVQETSLQVVIVGSGPLEQTLKHLAESLGVAQQVVFLGSVSNEQLRCLHTASYAFVFSSVSENEAFGLVQQEAMVRGKAVINTALKSGVPWVARDGKEAITVAPNDALGLRNAMLYLQQNPEYAQKLGQAGKKRCMQLFRQQTFRDSCADIYESL